MAEPSLLDPKMFLQEYLQDARDAFECGNQAILELEKDPTQLEHLNAVFRTVHTLKGSSALIGFTGIVELAHFIEEYLDRLRNRELAVSTNAIDLLFDALDMLQKLVDDYSQGHNDQDIVRTVHQFLEELRHKISQVETQELLIHQGVIAIDESGIVVSFNAAAERIFHWQAADIVGRKVNLLMPEPFASEHDKYLSNYLLTGKARIIGIGREVVGLRQDGTTFPMDLAVNEMRLEGKRLFVGTVRELTDRRAKALELAQPGKTQTIRVQADLLDNLFNLVGELIITRNQIVTVLSDALTKELRGPLATLDRLVNDMQEKITAARLVPVDEIFQKFPRLVRDLARERHKEVEFFMEGRQIELDKAILDGIGEPLLHLLRNAVDHGIEPAEERHRHNKPGKGTITLSARRAENHILIVVADDGRGLDPAQIRASAIAKGFLDAHAAEGLSAAELVNLLFKAGFSTSAEVTGISGRGVGLDVVRNATERLGGRVEVNSEPGRGSRFTLRLPLATAIMQTLMVAVGDQIFAIPSDLVLETLEVKPADLRGVGSKEVIVLRDQVVPFVRLHAALNLPQGNGQSDLVAVITHLGDRLIGLGVDAVLDQMENIIKPFDPLAKKMRGFSGGTILGDGRVALLLDVPALFTPGTIRAPKRGPA